MRFFDAVKGEKPLREIAGNLHDLSRDGRWIALTRQEFRGGHCFDTAFLVDALSGEIVLELPSPLGQLRAAAFSPPGDLLAVSRRNRQTAPAANTASVTACLPASSPVARPVTRASAPNVSIS